VSVLAFNACNLNFDEYTWWMKSWLIAFLIVYFLYSTAVNNGVNGQVYN